MVVKFAIVFAWLLAVGLIGCQAQQTGNNPDSAETENSATISSEPFEYSQVELSDAKFRTDGEGVCWFELHYKFVKGMPTANYLLALRFPGTKNACLKEIAAWQLQTEGVIKDGLTLQESTLKDFEFVLSEAEVPMEGYTDISNVLTGTYQAD